MRMDLLYIASKYITPHQCDVDENERIRWFQSVIRRFTNNSVYHQSSQSPFDVSEA